MTSLPLMKSEHDKTWGGFLLTVKSVGSKGTLTSPRPAKQKWRFMVWSAVEQELNHISESIHSLQHITSNYGSGVGSFLGLATCMGPFLKNLSSLSSPLCENATSVDSDVPRAFSKVKALKGDQTIPSHFDPYQKIKLQVKTSWKGLGTTSIQNAMPVTFISKALTPVEQYYTNIEQEVLAVYGCERFPNYLFHHSFALESYHKPLAAIHVKHLSVAPPRLRQLLLHLLPCDLIIRYTPGEKGGNHRCTLSSVRWWHQSYQWPIRHDPRGQQRI